VIKNANPLSQIKIGHPVETLPWKTSQAVPVNQNMQKFPTSTDRGARSEKPPALDNDDKDDDEQSSNVDFGPYMAKMKKDIQAKWHPPKGFEERRIVAVFSIRRDGTILEPSIVQGSGTDAVDETALEALRQASPLDPLPKGAPKSVQIRY